MKTKSSSEAQGSVPGTLRVIETVIPGVRMFRTYHRRLLRADVVAGVTIFAILVHLLLYLLFGMYERHAARIDAARPARLTSMEGAGRYPGRSE